MYEYRGKVVEVYDGDTIWMDLDLGFKVFHRVKIRLKDVWCPEMYTGEQGLKAKKELIRIVGYYSGFIVVTEKDKMTFDRYIGTLFNLSRQDNINKMMMDIGYVEKK